MKEFMSIIIREIDDREQWNCFLTHQVRGHLLQSYEWGELNEHMGRRVYRLGAFMADHLIGSMQLVVVPVGLPLPKMRTNWLYCSRGPTLSSPDRLVLMQLLEAARHIARRERAIVLRVEPNIADDSEGADEQDAWLAMYHKSGFLTNSHSVHGRRSWVLDLRPSPQALLANFQPLWRERSFETERAGVQIREASPADFDMFYTLLLCASERDGLVVHSRDYYQTLARSFIERGNGVILFAEYYGEPVATKLLLRFGDWCWDMFEAARDVPGLHPLYLVQYHALLWAREQGCRFFDFRTIPEVLSPVEDMWDAYMYKRGFGGYSRLNIPTQDYVYQPLVYAPWRRLTELRYDEQRHKERQAADCEQDVVLLDQAETLSEI